MPPNLLDLSPRNDGATLCVAICGAGSIIVSANGFARLHENGYQTGVLPSGRRGNRPIAAMSVFAITSRLSGPRVGETSEFLQEAVREIEARLPPARSRPP